MRLEESFAHRESSLLYKLKELQVAIDDRTGKGSAAEDIIEELLLRPFLPPGFLCGKGAVICSTKPDLQSSAIDRVIFDTRVSMPLVYDKSHSIFPAEVVAGMVEITMRLDARKLKIDIERMAPVKRMTGRRYLVPKPGTKTQVITHRTEGGVSPRSFIIGRLPTQIGMLSPLQKLFVKFRWSLVLLLMFMACTSSASGFSRPFRSRMRKAHRCIEYLAGQVQNESFDSQMNFGGRLTGGTQYFMDAQLIYAVMFLESRRF